MSSRSLRFAKPGGGISLLGVPAAAVPDCIAWVDALSPVFLFTEPAQIANATAAIDPLLA